MGNSRVTAVLLLPVLVVALAIAGCGGGSSNKSASVSSTSETTSSPTSTSTTTSGAATSSTGTSTSSSSTASSSTAAASKAAKKPPAQIALRSSAFTRGGKVPVRYTCDGANVSPPLAWSKVPAGTVQLFLFALDLTGGPKQAIRWAVGGISPSAHGFPAGSIPAGAVVGRNSEGKASWGGICPTKGKAHSFIFLLYALTKKIAVANGFNPTAVQRQLNSSDGGAGLLFATYQRS